MGGDSYLYKLFNAKHELANLRNWSIQIAYLALYTGEMFVHDHGRPMTAKEKQDWVTKHTNQQ